MNEFPTGRHLHEQGYSLRVNIRCQTRGVLPRYNRLTPCDTEFSFWTVPCKLFPYTAVLYRIRVTRPSKVSTDFGPYLAADGTVELNRILSRSLHECDAVLCKRAYAHGYVRWAVESILKCHRGELLMNPSIAVSVMASRHADGTQESRAFEFVC